MRMPDENLMDAIAQRDLLYTFMARVSVQREEANSILKEMLGEDMVSHKETGADREVDYTFAREVIRFIDATERYYNNEQE
tara:strand:- start:664 stop:906 length:243 start_codon:yes stop_codon:yes gene_type:complete